MITLCEAGIDSVIWKELNMLQVCVFVVVAYSLDSAFRQFIAVLHR